MADALDVNAVNVIVRQAVQGINVNKHGQTLEIQGAEEQQPLTLTDHDIQYFATFLQENPHAVEKLTIMDCSFLTRQAVEILRWHFTSRAMSLRHINLDTVNLGNVTGRRLLSGLNGNAYVTRLDLNNVGLEGHAGGVVISEVLQHNPSLTVLMCNNLRLGVEGARAMQPGIRGNHTLRQLMLDQCQLGDEGISLIADALLYGNTNVRGIGFVNNGITSNSLPHVTRLLQRPSSSSSSSLQTIVLDHNPGLFDNHHHFGKFAIALQNSQVTFVSMDFCQLPGHVMAALFRALSTKRTSTDRFEVYDNDQLRGANLECLLEIIPQIRNLRQLRINLNFMDESVLSAFRRNTSIQHLHITLNARPWQEVTNGPVFAILKRNRWLYKACKLLDSERGRRPIPLGLWSKAIERLTPRDDNNTGASAVYKILQERLAPWCDSLVTATAPSPPPSPPRPVSVAAAASMVATSSTTTIHDSTKRLRHQEESAKDDDKKATSSTLEQGKEKQPRQS